MKHQRVIISCLLLVAMVVVGSTYARAVDFAVRGIEKDSVHLQLFDNTMAGLERKVAESKKEGKKVMLFIYVNHLKQAPWTLKKTFKEDKVAEFINARFDVLYYDVSNYDNTSKTNDKDMEKILKKYAALNNPHLERGAPSYVLIDPEDKLKTASLLMSVLTADQLIDKLQGWLDNR